MHPPAPPCLWAWPVCVKLRKGEGEPGHKTRLDNTYSPLCLSPGPPTVFRIPRKLSTAVLQANSSFPNVRSNYASVKEAAEEHQLLSIYLQ